MRKRWSVVLSVLVVTTLFLSACQVGPTAEEIVAKMQEVEASTESAHAVVEINAQVEDVNLEVTIELWEKSPNLFRAEVIEANEGEFAGVVSVSDGQQAWLYHPGENTVVTGPLGDLEVEEIPVDPQQALQFLEEGIQWAMDNFDVALAGEEDLDGVATYKLVFTPKEDQEYPFPIPVGAEATLWVEQERWIVRQAYFDGSSFGEGWVRVRSLELNPVLDEALFRFEIPEGAEVIKTEDLEPKPLTLEEARAQAGFDLLVPAYVPQGVTLVAVLGVEDAIVLQYDHADVSFAIVQGSLPHLQDGFPQTEFHGEVVDVIVRGQTATLATDAEAGKSLLYWTENGVDITIAGQIDQEEILKVAESLQ